MAETAAYLLDQSSRDRDFLEGLRRGFLAMSGPVVDVENLRRGLIDVIRPVRARQRFGNIPPAARSGLELLILILMNDDNEARGSVLAELLEALADAGLSEVGLPMFEGLPQVVRDSERARRRCAVHELLGPEAGTVVVEVPAMARNSAVSTRPVLGGASHWLPYRVWPCGHSARRVRHVPDEQNTR